MIVGGEEEEAAPLHLTMLGRARKSKSACGGLCVAMTWGYTDLIKGKSEARVRSHGGIWMGTVIILSRHFQRPLVSCSLPPSLFHFRRISLMVHAFTAYAG
jgi:hypothetical protein